MKNYGTNDYRQFIEDLDIDQIDDLRKALRGVGLEGTLHDGGIAVGTVAGRVEIIRRGSSQYSLRDCIDTSKGMVHANRATTSHACLLDILDEELRKRIAPCENVEQYFYQLHGRSTD